VRNTHRLPAGLVHRLRDSPRAVALLLAGSALRWALLGSPLRGAVQTLREAAVVSATVALLCPLLHTLTATISGDTVAACIVASLLLHLYLHDYEPGHDVADTVAGSASLGCALFASVLLSSRLGSEAQVFAVMCFSVSVFVGWPFLRRDIVRTSFAAQATLTAGLHLAAVLALAETVLPLLGGVHAAAVLFITFVCPWSLVRCNDLKQRINGCVRACVRVQAVTVRSLRTRQALGRGAPDLGSFRDPSFGGWEERACVGRTTLVSCRTYECSRTVQ
jgi:Phosphatidylinositol N-acetylglucosaminyltransferase